MCQDHRYDFRNGSIRWQISISIKVIFDILLQFSPFPIYYCFKYLTVSKILTFHIFDLQEVGQDHEVKFLQLRHSMANINDYKSRAAHFLPAITTSEILTFHIFYLQKVGHGVQFL